jgi:hypothetical protein
MTFQAILGSLDVTGLDAFGVQWSVHALDGWGAPSTTLSPVQKPRQSGAWAGDSFSTQRHIVLSGIVVAPSQDALTDAIDRLSTATTLAAFTLTIVEGSRTRWISARRSDEVLFQYVTGTLATWSVQVIALDSRKFGTPLSNFTFLPVTTGGLTVPFTVPFTIASTVVSGQVSLTNPGNETGPVVLRIDGPTSGPQITHVGSAQALVFSSSLVLGSGEWLTVDMEKRTAMANDQSSRSGYITSRGWSGFDPGLNVWSFTATGYNAASKLTVTGTPSWK